MLSHSLFTRLVVLLGCLALVAGCGDGRPKRVRVSGRVTIDGKPLTSGNIRVVPAEERVATGTIGPDGRFTLGTFDKDDGCVLGTHPIAVIAVRRLNSSSVEHLVPKKYGEYTTSGKTVTIDGPKDDLQIELSWEGGKPFIERESSTGDFDPSKL